MLVETCLENCSLQFVRQNVSVFAGNQGCWVCQENRNWSQMRSAVHHGSAVVAEKIDYCYSQQTGAMLLYEQSFFSFLCNSWWPVLMFQYLLKILITYKGRRYSAGRNWEGNLNHHIEIPMRAFLGLNHEILSNSWTPAILFHLFLTRTEHSMHHWLQKFPCCSSEVRKIWIRICIVNINKWWHKFAVSTINELWTFLFCSFVKKA